MLLLVCSNALNGSTGVACLHGLEHIELMSHICCICGCMDNALFVRCRVFLNGSYVLHCVSLYLTFGECGSFCCSIHGLPRRQFQIAFESNNVKTVFGVRYLHWDTRRIAIKSQNQRLSSSIFVAWTVFFGSLVLSSNKPFFPLMCQ